MHDLLAFLAEQMIEMNKTKQEEIKGFLSWLERTIGAKIDDLSNKTKLRAYHYNDFTTLLEVLLTNRRKLSIDPRGRKIQKLLGHSSIRVTAKYLKIQRLDFKVLGCYALIYVSGRGLSPTT